MTRQEISLIQLLVEKMKTLSFLMLVGIIMIGYSFTLEPFTNVELYNKKYSILENGQNVEFYKLREEMLTAKYRLFDTGINLVLFSSVIMTLLGLGNGKITSPNKKAVIVSLSILLPLITVGGYIIELIQGMGRSEYPHWADSLGIPLIGAPVFMAILLAWSLLHILLIKKVAPISLKEALTQNKKQNIWLLGVSFITVLLVVQAMYYGQYWYSIPGVLWLYFYLSIAASRLESPNN